MMLAVGAGGTGLAEPAGPYDRDPWIAGYAMMTVADTTSIY